MCQLAFVISLSGWKVACMRSHIWHWYSCIKWYCKRGQQSGLGYGLTPSLHLYIFTRYVKFIIIGEPWPSVYFREFPTRRQMEFLVYNTRNDNTFRVPSLKNQISECLIMKRLAKLVNQTPTDIINRITTHSMNGYATYV